MNLAEYIAEKSGKTLRALALDMGYSPSTLSRQFRAENALTLETLRDISEATDIDFLDLALRAGLITKDHANKIRGRGALELATNEALLEELKKRLDTGATYNHLPPLFKTLNPEEIRESKARAALAKELEKDDVDLAAYRHTDGDEVDYDSYH